MLTKHLAPRLLLLISLSLFFSGCANSVNSLIQTQPTQDSPTTTLVAAQSFNYQDYAQILQQYVNSQGRVNYEALKNNRQQLDKFNQAIGAVSPDTYNSWPEKEQIAFLVNAYNSLTLEAIIDNYPVKSIRNIPGVWKRKKFPVMGQEMTLDQIEHQILRQNFDEPRIHLALVCAAISCPKLRIEPYIGEKLDFQLDEQTRIFLANPNHFRVDDSSQTVYVSSIFKWFGQDFEKSYGKTENLSNLNRKETAFLNFFSQYLSPFESDYLTKGGYKVKYLNYDWSLNTQ